MDEKNFLTERFEAERARLKSVAYRMLGGRAEAEDAVQEAWLRLARADAGDVGNLSGWLTTVTARICLDMLRSRKARREDSLAPSEEAANENSAFRDAGHDPETDAALADSVGVALLVVLDALAPAERVAFVLHDMFDLSFDEIGPIVGRTPTAARQLASRARRRVQSGQAPDVDRDRRREVVSAFLAASRGGDFGALLAVLDPDVVLRADAAAVAMSVARGPAYAPVLAPEIHGAGAVAQTFKGRAAAAQLALLDGDMGLVYAPGGAPQVAFEFVIEDGRIVEIGLTADPETLAGLELEIPKG